MIKLIMTCDRCNKTENIKYSWKDMINTYFNSWNYLYHINLPNCLLGWKTSDKDKNLCPQCFKEYNNYMEKFK